MTLALLRKCGFACVLFLRLKAAGAQTPESVATDTPGSLGMDIIRLFGALAIVFAILFGAVWLLRNWQRVVAKRGSAAKLAILEAKSLGPRQTLYVIAYERQRMLIASSQTGITMLSALPADDTPQAVPPSTPAPVFAEILQKVLGSK